MSWSTIRKRIPKIEPIIFITVKRRVNKALRSCYAQNLDLGVQANGLDHIGKVIIPSGGRATFNTGRVGYWMLGGPANPCMGMGTKFMNNFTIDINWLNFITTTLGTEEKINIGIVDGNDGLTVIENRRNDGLEISYCFMMAT